VRTAWRRRRLKASEKKTRARPLKTPATGTTWEEERWMHLAMWENRITART
jgi:hypothetical protein